MVKTVSVNTNALFFVRYDFCWKENTEIFQTTKNFLPGMLESNKGHIVTIASMAGKCGVAGLVSDLKQNVDRATKS